MRGGFANSAGRETGITVNGVTALQYGSEFMANHVPLVQGANTITVTAVDTSGRKYSQSVAVTADTTGPYCTATTIPEAALSPYEGELRIAAPVELRTSNVLAYGWGQVTYGQGTPENYPLEIDGPGFCRLVVEAVDYANLTYTDEVAVLVYDRTQLDALLQAKWNAMKNELAAGNIERAAAHFSGATQDTYREIFTATAAQLPQVAAQMRPIQLITVEDGVAKYRIKRSEVHQGRSYDISYWIYFESVGNGLWKIHRY
ncbi:MAG: hypothetical protein M0036_12315 [Desulfobacteraceae bacterium]|nr:hypothetical protein [Desulfobacteraceae bacterium]